MRTINQLELNAVTSASSTPGAALLANELFNITAIGTFSDSGAAGTLSLEGSNDPANGALIPNFVPTNWVTIPGATASVASGATTLLVPTNPICYNWIRVLWAKSAGAGTVTVAVAAQGY
jgi:hypothetical protein